jgi:hypothetical protein
MTYEQHAERWTIVSDVIFCCFCYCPSLVCSSVPVDRVFYSFPLCSPFRPVFRLLFPEGTTKRVKLSFNSSPVGEVLVSCPEAGLPNLPNTKVVLALSLQFLENRVPHLCEHNAQNFASSYLSKH